MLNTVNECKDFRRKLESRRREGRYHECLQEVNDFRRGGEIGDNWSIRTLFEEIVPDGREAVRMMETSRRGGGRTFVEAGGDAIVTADFSNIIGQLTYADVLEQFEMPAFIGRELMPEKTAATQQQEIVPGVSMIGDKAQSVGENEDYPLVGLNEQWIVAPNKIKTGFMMAVTEEMIAEDKTGQVMDHMNQASEWLAVNQEKERLNTILGITTSFRWGNNAAQATYANSFTGFTLDNLIASNGLADYTDLDTVDNAFSETVDPATGEPVMIAGPMTVLVPRALRNTANRVINATEVRVGDITTGSGIQTIGGNPLQYTDSPYTVKSSPYVSNITSSDSSWFVGDFQKAFEDRVVWPLGMFVEDSNSSKLFERDWVTRLKVRRKSAPTVRRPWYVKKCTE